LNKERRGVMLSAIWELIGIIIGSLILIPLLILVVVFVVVLITSIIEEIAKIMRNAADSFKQNN
jgi:hypothetical protein